LVSWVVLLFLLFSLIFLLFYLVFCSFYLLVFSSSFSYCFGFLLIFLIRSYSQISLDLCFVFLVLIVFELSLFSLFVVYRLLPVFFGSIRCSCGFPCYIHCLSCVLLIAFWLFLFLSWLSFLFSYLFLSVLILFWDSCCFKFVFFVIRLSLLIQLSFGSLVCYVWGTLLGWFLGFEHLVFSFFWLIPDSVVVLAHGLRLLFYWLISFVSFYYPLCLITN
jgi:hypothetical protein